ncbi:MAG TPA: anaerobic ribonucleoside-triphosphate reductase activating protein [Porphyromonadaceae bacterium]|nr:anaerobic ribonucleoside-triphosphate reductase activating protein [Porphyromonadaceae bacterium]
MRVLRIVEGTSVDGPGLRTSVYLAGCAHHCPGCHNPQSWDPAGGDDMSVDELMRVIAWNEAPLTLSGGDPLAQPEQVLELVRRVKTELNINIWLYTGYTWEQIVADRRLADVVRWVDVVVEGPFILAQRDITLHFRGSSNQRIIDVPASLTSSSAVELVQFS